MNAHQRRLARRRSKRVFDKVWDRSILVGIDLGKPGGDISMATFARRRWDGQKFVFDFIDAREVYANE